MASLAPYILKRPWLTKLLTPAANWYAGASGYRQLGLRYASFFFLSLSLYRASPSPLPRITTICFPSFAPTRQFAEDARMPLNWAVPRAFGFVGG